MFSQLPRRSMDSARADKRFGGVDQPGGHLVAPAGHVTELVCPRSEDLDRARVVAVPGLPAKHEALPGARAVGHGLGVVVGGSGDAHAGEQNLARRGGAQGAGGEGAHSEQAAECTDDVSRMHGCFPGRADRDLPELTIAFDSLRHPGADRCRLLLPTSRSPSTPTRRPTTVQWGAGQVYKTGTSLPWCKLMRQHEGAE